MRKILVTGGYGFVGSEVIKCLSNNPEIEILATDICLLDREEKNSNIVRITNEDLFNNSKYYLNKVDCVIGCAFARDGDTQKLAKGLEFTDKLFNTLKKNHLTNIINISSQGVYKYDNQIDFLDENDEIGPLDAYGVAKYATECMLNDVFSDGENITNVRLASVNMKQRFTQKMIDNIINNGSINIISKRQKTSLIDVRDVARGLVCIATNSDKKWNKIYNLGTGRVDTIEEIAYSLQKISKDRNREIMINLNDNDPILFNPMKIDRMRNDFNYKAIIGLDKMLADMFDASESLQ